MTTLTVALRSRWTYLAGALLAVLLVLVFVTQIVTVVAMEQAKQGLATTAMFNFIEAMSVIFLVFYSLLLVVGGVGGRRLWREARKNGIGPEQVDDLLQNYSR